MDLGESSAFFRICCLEFYFPRYSVAFPFPSLSLSLSLSSLASPFSLSLSLFASFLLAHSRYIFFLLFLLSARSLASIPRIALLGISEVLSRIQGLASSLMDGSAILFHSSPLGALTSYRLSCNTPSPLPCAYSPTRCEIMPRLNSRIHTKCVQRV